MTYDSPQRNPGTGAYSDSSIDFYRAPAVAGACDNQECHGGPTGRTVLSTVMGRVRAQRRGAAGGGVGLRDLPQAQRTCREAGALQRSCGNTVAGCHGTDAANAYPDGARFRTARQARDARCADRGGERPQRRRGRATAASATRRGAHGRQSGDAGGPDERRGDALHDDQRARTAATGRAGGVDVTCSDVNCHYNTTPPAADWYAGGGGVHVLPRDGVAAYTAGAAERAHAARGRGGGRRVRLRVLGVPSLGRVHDRATSGRGEHLLHGGVGQRLTRRPRAATGAVKYGAGTVASYYGCAGIACHGDYAGGNTANTPNWGNTDAVHRGNNGDGHCGSCHGRVVRRRTRCRRTWTGRRRPTSTGTTR